MSKSFDEIDAYCHRLVSESQFAGISWHVRQGSYSSGTRVYGFADHNLRCGLNADTIFRLYSMTKPLISVLCLQLLEQGHVQLSDAVSRWIPALKTQRVQGADGTLHDMQRQITIEDLLTHRAGFSYDFLPECSVAAEYRRLHLAEDGSRCLTELINVLAELPLAHQPGLRWYYSYSTDVLAHLLECVSGKPLRQLLQELLLLPLNMADTDFQVSPEKQHRLADMFGQKKLGEMPPENISTNVLKTMDVEASYPVFSNGQFARGGIGLFSTVDDYLKFMQLMATGVSPDGCRLISPPMLNSLWENRLTTSQMPISIGNSTYPGYGWGLAGRVMCQPADAVHTSCRGEGGWAGAASTYFWIDRAKDFSGIVMAQYLGSAIELGPSIQSLSYAANA
ncbi:MAG: serine hydrolase domain-containing protein [Granulosicoccus sp.]